MIVFTHLGAISLCDSESFNKLSLIMVWRTERGKKLVVTLSKTPPSQKEASDVPLKWNVFEVSPFLTEEVSHISLNGNTFEVSAI